MAIFMESISEYLSELQQVIKIIDKKQINMVINKLVEVFKRSGNVYIFGNGGSASTASHFVNDFNKGIDTKSTQKFKLICLNDNVSCLTAVANDLGYDQVFRFQLENYLNSEDLVIGISGSGNSQNVISAIEYANLIGAETVALTGYNGGKLKERAKYYIHIPVNDMRKVEDIHLILGHLITKVIAEFLVSEYLEGSYGL